MQIQNNLEGILKQIETYASAAGVKAPQLIAVSKGQSIEKIRELITYGWLDFGESYLQEFALKANELAENSARWHFIGQLQSRKIKSLVALASSVHAVASLKHAKLIAEAAEQCHKVQFPIFLAVNMAAEPGKSGVPLNEVLALANDIMTMCPTLSVRGIMAVPPRQYSDENFSSPPDEYFLLRELANQVGAGKLSLGMSSDLRIAIAVGTDIVRIGTNIFGERSYT